MSTTELKNKVIDKLETVNDQVLKKILALIESETEIYKVNDGERNAIQEGLKQLENDEFLTNKEVEKEIDTWLNK